MQLRAFAIVAFVLATACQAPESVYGLADGTTGTTPLVYMALTPWPSPNDPNAYKLLMLDTNKVFNETGLKFCFGDAAACTAEPTRLSIEVVKKADDNDKPYYESAKFSGFSKISWSR